jgi:hypothetical protein
MDTQNNTQQKAAYKDMKCPHCFKSFKNASGKFKIPFTKRNLNGSVEMDPRPYIYEVIIKGVSLQKGENVDFFCPHCNSFLRVIHEDTYFFTVVTNSEGINEYAFMSSIYGNKFTLIVNGEEAMKLRNGKMSLQEATKFHDKQMEHYANSYTLIP